MRCWTAGIIFTTALTLGTLSAQLAAHAQQPAKVRRIGFLSPSSLSDPRTQRFFEAFRQGLRELGHVEGQNIAIESRWAETKYERLPGLAAELVRLKVDVIVTYAPPAIQAAKEATGTIPIVMGGIIDPIATGFVASLARPGGNITGLSLMAPELVGKQLEMLKEVVPKVSRVAILGNPANAGTAPQLREAEGAARALGVRLQPLEARDPKEIDSAFAAMTRERAGALIVLVDSMLGAHRRRIADLAAKRRLPAASGLAEFAEAGGLMAYGASGPDRFRRAATYVDKILKGAKPADLPVEQPTRFELVVNLKTAKALGLTFPQSILIRADQVIQ
jgi:putative ABC transport system substrate-binding protein